MPRQLAIGKKVSLAGVAEGWGEECYAVMRPADYDDMLAVDNVDNSDKAAAAEFQKQFVQDHFIRGMVRIDGDDQPVDMEAADTHATVALCDRLFLACLGDDLDPKEVRAAAAHSGEPSNDEQPTGTP